MPQYVIERELTGVGALSKEQLKEVAKKSNGQDKSFNFLGALASWLLTVYLYFPKI